MRILGQSRVNGSQPAIREKGRELHPGVFQPFNYFIGYSIFHASLRAQFSFFLFFESIIRFPGHPETCMMNVEAHHESSITDTMAKILTIVSRRNFDGK